MKQQKGNIVVAVIVVASAAAAAVVVAAAVVAHDVVAFGGCGCLLSLYYRVLYAASCWRVVIVVVVCHCVD